MKTSKVSLNWLTLATKHKPLGRHSPWVWAIEFVRGCNLRCWHCACRIFPPDRRPRFMSVETWTALCHILAQNTPRTRLELAQTGEPTLHPYLLDCLRIARRITPTTQLQVTTNGVGLLRGDITYKELFDAGAHSVYVDMYASAEKHIALARAAGVEWYMYAKPRTVASNPKHRMANTYYGDPAMQLIILQDNPEYRTRWRRMGRLSTWLNHLDWEAAIPYGLVPVRKPYKRKCTMPMRMGVINVDGFYQFCCVDFVSETAGLLGSVHNGSEGFRAYWFGRLMQSIRRRLVVADRAGVPYCSRCNCAFAKCDWVKIWPDGSLDKYWDGSSWQQMPKVQMDFEVFNPGWVLTKQTMESLPSEDDEARILRASTRQIIYSTKDAKIGQKQLNLGI